MNVTLNFEVLFQQWCGRGLIVYFELSEIRSEFPWYSCVCDILDMVKYGLAVLIGKCWNVKHHCEPCYCGSCLHGIADLSYSLIKCTKSIQIQESGHTLRVDCDQDSSLDPISLIQELVLCIWGP